MTASGENRGVNGPGGGSIWIIAERLLGDGTISANGGGSNANNNKGGGGGGRVAVYVTGASSSQTSLATDFTGVISSFGGDGLNFGKAHSPGAAGTVYLETHADRGKGHMIIRNDSEKLARAASKGWTLYGTAQICNGVTWNVSALAISDHGRVGINRGGELHVPSFSVITGDGSTANILRFNDGGELTSDVLHDVLVADGFGIESYGTSTIAEHHVVIPESSTLKVAGTLTVGSLKLNGVKLAKGTYSAMTLAETYANVSGEGTIEVLGLEKGLVVVFW